MHRDLFLRLVADTLASAPPRQAAVLCLCAQWCGVCREYAALFERMAAAHPQLVFRWIDVEDEADALDDLDIETFPTLVIGDASQLHFAGPTLPTEAALGQLLRRVMV